LPYAITSATLETYLPMRSRTGRGPTALTLMLQKEVGKRIVAKKGEVNRLALFCGYYAEARLAFGVPRGAFSPPPKVDSCVVRFDVRRDLPLDGKEEALFFRLIAAAFAMKRKKIRNTVANELGPSMDRRLAFAGLSGEERPEEISLQEWVTLVRQM
jgi:16S rRNA (adenine1518-N6/adenine1519-N6)-dimethyltransferase